MKKIIIVPAYNEELNILNVIKDIKEHAQDFDYIIVNDGSKDKTLEICKKEKLNHISLPINSGIGRAMQRGYLYAYKNGYDIAVQIDGDGQHDASYVCEMLRVMKRKRADMIIGSRYKNKKGFQSSLMRRAGIKIFTALIGLSTGVIITDSTSGFRMVRRRVIKKYAYDYPGDYPEPESLVRLLKDGGRVCEIPVIMRARQGGKSSISGMNSLYYMIKVSIGIILAAVG